MCQRSVLEVLSSEDEDSTSSDNEGEHNASNLFPDVVAQDGRGMLVESFLEDGEFVRTAVSCHLSLFFLSQETHGF